MMKMKLAAEAAWMMFKFYNMNYDKTNLVYNKMDLL